MPWQGNTQKMVIDGEQLTAYISDLQPAHSYQLRVVAENSVGQSNMSDVISLTTSEEIPGASPRDIRVRVKNSETLFVSWKVIIYSFINIIYLIYKDRNDIDYGLPVTAG